MLLIRPGNELPLLLAIASSELAEPSPPSSQELAREALAALGGVAEDIVGPMLPLARQLLPLVLTRDVTVDAADPDSAHREVSDFDATLAGLYSAFLQVVRDSESERRAAMALHQLWQISSEALPGFLEDHPELSSAAARGIVTREYAAGRAEENGEILQARLRLVESLTDGRPAREVAAEYLRALKRYVQKIVLQLEQLLPSVEAFPGPAGIPQTREALRLATMVSQNDLQAGLSADLARRLLADVVPDDQVIEEIIGLLTRALSLVPSNDRRWPEWAGNLAAAYHRRLTGDPTENWETARDLMERACAAADRSVAPRVWATSQTNYGYLLSERPGGPTPEELGHAIEHLRAGLEVRSAVADPVDWAFSQLNLGLLYRRMGTGNYLREAAECYREGLAHLRPEDRPQLWAALQHNAANVLLDSDPADLDGAETALQSVLEVINPSADPLTYARALRALGRIEAIRHGKLSTTAVTPRRRALQLLTPAMAPGLYLSIGGELVDAYSELGDWQAAADIYTGMLTAFSALYDTQASAQGRRNILQRHRNLARWAAYALARAGRPEHAVEAIENGRARELSITVARNAADLARLDAADPEIARHYRAALVQYRAAQANIAQAAVQTDARRGVTSAEQGIRLVLQNIRAIPGFERFLQPMTVADIRQAADGHPVVYLVSAPAGSYVLTVSPGESDAPTIDAVAVPEITSTDVMRLVLLDDVSKAPGLLLAQSVSLLRRISMLPSALERLVEMQPLARPVAEVLIGNPGNSAIVIPTGLLGIVPLHAIPIRMDEAQVLDDAGEIQLAPSVAVFAACHTRTSTSRYRHLIGVADPENALPSLPGTWAELAAIAHLFEPPYRATCAAGSEATRRWLLEHVEQASHLHFGCHGSSTLDDASGGRLYLADDTELTMDDLIDGRLEGCRLAVASACQSGHYSMADVPDEFTGLPAGFLQAGAACAIVSLWQVDDRATAMLMVRLYELLDPDKANGPPPSPPAALRRARTWLRELTADQEEHFIRAHQPLDNLFNQDGKAPVNRSSCGQEILPYAAPQYWAAFTAWGD
jgi:CHAT domain-containing protein/tetratricopeptide (TPR) repeat protein